ncbi:GNAT family N-acetyltransferase [Mammaliicoccus sciuri]|uniref:GNAT family N-acetyltransferase n=1 Tax=Mammaliicoccus sciuri TaxID=1296 RepID=UPI0034DD46E2
MFKTKIKDNLSLKILEERDAQELFQIIENSREYLGEWLPFVKFTKEKKDSQEFIKSALKQFSENDGFHCGIWYNNKLVGVIGLHYINWLNEKTSIGYYIDETYQNLGIITECTKFLIAYCFEELKLNRIEIQTSTKNIKSQKIPQKLGFKQEGILRQNEKLNNKYSDSYVFSLLKSEYYK